MMEQSAFILFVLFLYVSSCNSSVILINEDMNNMIEFTSTSSYCRIITDRETIQFVHDSRPNYVKIVPNDYFQYMLQKCKEPFLNAIERGLKFIYPGTNWCGPGNVSKSYSDLGVHRAEDACCREHDNCPRALERGQCINDACNDSDYTRSHCDCDVNFQRCLQRANTETANTIGAIFFNVARIICFRGVNNCDVNLSNCPVEFLANSQYTAPQAPFYKKNIKAFFLNKLLRTFKLL